MVDAAVDAGPDGIAIEDVVTADGDTQVRQGDAVDLVITGRELGEVDAVLVGDLDATVLSGQRARCGSTSSSRTGPPPGRAP